MSIILFIALLLAPFISALDTPYCAGYAKELTFWVLSLICIGVTLIRTRQWNIRIYDIIALLLVLVITVNPRFWDNETYTAIALVLIWWSITRLRWSKTMLYGLVAAGFIHVLFSLNQIVLFPSPPIKGVMGNSGIMGIYVALIAPLSLGMAFTERQWWGKTLMGIVTILFFGTILITRSRTALLAFIISSGYLLGRFIPLKSYFRKWIGTRNKRIAFGLTVAAMIVVCGVVLFQYRTGSVSGRVLIYRATTDMIADKPLIGHGYHTFAARYPDYQARFFAGHPDSPLAVFADNSEVAFNEYLHVASEYGLVGLLIGIGLLVWLFRVPDTADRLVLMCRAALIAFLVAACFSYPLRRYETLLVVLIVTGILASKDARKIGAISRWGLLLPMLLLVWFYFGFGKIIYKQAVGYPVWQEARMGRLKMEERLRKYEAASVFWDHHVAFLYNYAVVLSGYEQAEAGNTLFRKVIPYMNTSNIQVMIGANHERLEKPDSAEMYYRHAHDMTPNRFYPLYKLMTFYQDRGVTVQMRYTAHEILRKEIKIPSYTVDRIKMEANEILR